MSKPSLEKISEVTWLELHSEIRGREHYFAEDYEKPEENFLDIDTTGITVEDCISKIGYSKDWVLQGFEIPNVGDSKN